MRLAYLTSESWLDSPLFFFSFLCYFWFEDSCTYPYISLSFSSEVYLLDIPYSSLFPCFQVVVLHLRCLYESAYTGRRAFIHNTSDSLHPLRGHEVGRVGTWAGMQNGDGHVKWAGVLHTLIIIRPWRGVHKLI